MSSRAKPSPILEPGEAPSGAYGGILPGQIPRESTQRPEQGKGLLTFLRHPDENIPRNNRFEVLLATILWFSLLSTLSVATALLFASLHAIVPESPAQDLTTWKILCGVSLFPIFEELMFRLPLKRGRYTLLPALFLFSFYFTSGIFHVERISDDRLVLRLILSLGIMAAFFHRFNPQIGLFAFLLWSSRPVRIHALRQLRAEGLGRCNDPHGAALPVLVHGGQNRCRHPLRLRPAEARILHGRVAPHTE